MQSRRSRLAAFTLIELMIVVALVAIIIALAAPSFRDMILMQRLRGVNAQVVTDLAFARSEAVSRGTFVHLKFQQTSGMSCYIIYARNSVDEFPQCDCTAAEGSRCINPANIEVRTVQLPKAQSVTVAHASTLVDQFTISPRTGGIAQTAAALENRWMNQFEIHTAIDASRKFNNYFYRSGRITYCAPLGSTVGGESC